MTLSSQASTDTTSDEKNLNESFRPMFGWVRHVRMWLLYNSNFVPTMQCTDVQRQRQRQRHISIPSKAYTAYNKASNLNIGQMHLEGRQKWEYLYFSVVLHSSSPSQPTSHFSDRRLERGCCNGQLIIKYDYIWLRQTLQLFPVHILSWSWSWYTAREGCHAGFSNSDVPTGLTWFKNSLTLPWFSVDVVTHVLTSKKTATITSSFLVHSICIESGDLVEGPRWTEPKRSYQTRVTV